MAKMQLQTVPPPHRLTESEPMTLKKSDQFVPMKVIQKKGVNVSKSINKPKEIEPMLKN